MSTITATITIPDAIAPLIQDAATQAGQDLPTFVGAAVNNGQNLQGIANDRANQAFWRLQQAGTVPAEILAESRRFAVANAPKPAAAPATEASA